MYQAFDVPRWDPSSAHPPVGGPGAPVEGTVPPRRLPYSTKITRDGLDPGALRQIEDEIRSPARLAAGTQASQGPGKRWQGGGGIV